MRAAQLTSPGHIEVLDAPSREPDDGEVLVRMSMASICGSDLHLVYSGRGAPSLPGPPGFPGHEGVGVVVEGRGSHLRSGDVVLTVPRAHPRTREGLTRLPGCFAELQTLDETSCLPLPAGGEASRLLLAQQLGTVVYALAQRPVAVQGRTVCVLGQGSAGLFFTALLARAGAEVIAVDLVPSRLSESAAFGAEVLVDATSDDPVDAVREATEGRGTDYAIEAVGSVETVNQAIAMAAPGSEVLFYGVPASDELVPFDFNGLFRKRLRTISSYAAQLEPGLRSFHAAIDLIDRGVVDVTPFTTCVMPLDRLSDAFEVARTRPPGVNKVTITMEEQ